MEKKPKKDEKTTRWKRMTEERMDWGKKVMNGLGKIRNTKTWMLTSRMRILLIPVITIPISYFHEHLTS